MSSLKMMLYHPKTFGAAVFLVSLSAICAAWFFQCVMELVPCTICYLERDPYYFLIPVGVALLLVAPSSRSARLLELITFLALFAELALNLLHWGVEEKWWVSPFSSCHMISSIEGATRNMIAALPLSPVKPCDAPDFVFGIPLSLSHLSALYSLFVFCAIVFLWFCTRLRTPFTKGSAV